MTKAKVVVLITDSCLQKGGIARKARILDSRLEKPADWQNLDREESIPEKVLYPGIDAEE